jgi:ACS family tartrate transporter-like MFS transporter
MPSPASSPIDNDLPRCVRLKVLRRIIPLLFLLYIIAYLDRANAGFAKLQMEERLRFSPEVFGWALGLFYVGYLLLEIPGALIVEHWSARKWFTRILLTWGVCSMAMALVSEPWHFYLARFLLGLAEAGFFPGVIVYFTHWFPRAERARAMSGMLLAVPGSLALGAAVSSVLLRQDWFGLHGWQWVFIVEGAPAVLIGLALPLVMTDRPRDARWLTPEERDWLEQTLAAERRQTAAAVGQTTLGQALRLPTVWFLALGILFTNLGGMGVVFWLATMVKDFLGKGESVAADDSEVLLWTGMVYVCGLVGVVVSGIVADRTGQRKWCCAVAQLATGVFLVASAIPGQPWAMVFTWLCLAGFFAHSWFTPYWVLPTLTLTSSAAAVSIGLINMAANVPGFLSNTIMGYMKAAGLSDSARLIFLACGFVLGAVFVGLIRVPRPTPGAADKLATGDRKSP